MSLHHQQQQQPHPLPTGGGGGGGVPLPPTPSQLQSALDSSLWYILTLWPALDTAVRESWGGPSSADKRDWFAGALGDLLTTRPETDHDDLVEFLLQVMQDEFDCNVEDESEEVVVGEILGVRRVLGEEPGRWREVVAGLEERWRGRGRLKSEVVRVFDNSINEEVDEDEVEWEGFGDDGDVVMQDEVPTLVAAPAVKKERQEPEVDEEGFTKVTSKKKR